MSQKAWDTYWQGAAAAVEKADRPSGIGAEQIMAREKRYKEEKAPKQKLTAKVEDFGYTNSGKLMIFLDNGQIWRQLNVAEGKIHVSAKRENTAEIKEGLISGYRMTITGRKRPFRVERIK